MGRAAEKKTADTLKAQHKGTQKPNQIQEVQRAIQNEDQEWPGAVQKMTNKGLSVGIRLKK